MATREEVLAALSGVVDPGSGRDLVASGAAVGVSVEGGAVSFVLQVDPARGKAMEPLRKAAIAACEALEGVDRVTAVLTAHSDAPGAPAAAPPPPDLSFGGPKRAGPASKKIEGVARVIAIASGKGGVGKSTVAANLAVALAAEGKRIGLLDADVYGPSQPRMLGVSGRPSSPDGETILPLRNHGVTLMSVGLLTGEDEAVVWRGPMLMGALQQMLSKVAWGRLDALIVDLPPGTGDVQLTLAQSAELTGAVVVSTPQDIALLDARKALDMFAKMDTRILGIIENMSTFLCPHCGGETQLFGHGGARAEAERLGAPLLAEIPLHLDIRIAGDSGAPIVVSRPDGPEAAAFRALARALIDADAVA